MGFVWDIILIAVILWCVVSTAKKGFIMACKNIVSVVLTIVLMSTMHPVIMGYLQSSEIGNKVKVVVAENVTKTYEKEDIPQDTDTSDTEKSVEICNSLGLPAFLSQSIEKNLVEMSEIKNNVLEVITDSLSLLILKILALLIMFLLVKVFVFLALKILESLFKLPVLKTVNKGLGALVGVVNALLIVYLVCGLMNLVVPMDKMPQVQQVVDSTLILKNFYNNNILFSFMM